MKRIYLILALIGVAYTSINAQSVSEKEQNPIEAIVAESDSLIQIDIPEGIMNNLLKEEEVQHKQTGNTRLKPGINKIDGYRIQVFSDGRNQGSLESRAKARGNAIVARFPKYRGQMYTFSSAPNWYTRIGNFRTQAEASSALAEIKRAFPQYAAEMRVVKSKIVVVK